MVIQDGLLYTKTHQWVKFTGETALVGITDHAQHSMGGVVFINLPENGGQVTAGEPLGDIESLKTVSDIHSPVTGKVARVNEDLLDNPGAVNNEPYGYWMLEVAEITAKGDLMTPEEYRAYCGTLG